MTTSTTASSSDLLEPSVEASREERRANGRLVAIIVALLLISVAMYQAWVRHTAILAGAIVPALIMVLYAAWILYTARRDKHRARMAMNVIGLKEVVCTTPEPPPKERPPKPAKKFRPKRSTIPKTISYHRSFSIS